MALINQKFLSTVKDQNDPITTVELNFLEDGFNNYSMSSFTLPPFTVTSTITSWKDLTETVLLNLTNGAGYIIIKTDTPIYAWINQAPIRDGNSRIDPTVFPPILIKNCFILHGNIKSVYAINPSSNEDTPPLTANIKVLYVY